MPNNNNNTVARNKLLQAALRRQIMQIPIANYMNQYSVNASLAMAATKKRKRNNNQKEEEIRRKKWNEKRRLQANAQARFMAMDRISKALRHSEAAERRRARGYGH
jgi:23S rRNA pseudoU1915 N3-methylase RlmH